MPHPLSRRIWPAIVCSMTAALLWLYVIDRWTPSDLMMPVRDRGDWMEVAGRIQIAAEQGWRTGNVFGRIDRLGAPGTADWSLYPTPDRLVFWVAGQLSRGAGVYGAINLMAGLGCVIGALSFMLATRLLRWPVIWSFAGALLFAFCSYNLGWSLLLSLGLTFPWPVTLVVLHWVGARRPTHGQTATWTWLALGSGVCLGVGNPYFSFLAAQLGGFALLSQWRTPFRARRRAGLLFLCGLIGAFFLTHVSYFWARLLSNDSPVIERDLSGTEIYGMRPIEWLMPPDHHWWHDFSKWAMHYRSRTLFHGHEQGSYLGLVALSGLLFLGIVALRRVLLNSRATPRVPIGAWVIGWILILSMVGGLNTLMGMFGIDVFRAALRFSIVPGIIGIFWAVNGLRRISAKRPRWTIPLATAVTVFGLWDQTPPPPHTTARNEARVRHLRQEDLGRAMETAVREGGSVFLLPAIPFPEAGPRHVFQDYDHFHLFLQTKRLRWSYGGLKGSYSTRLGSWLEQLPVDDLAPALEAAGFDAVLIDRRAYPDRGLGWLHALETSGRTCIPLPEGCPMTAFKLNPNPSDSIPGPHSILLQPSWIPTPSRWHGTRSNAAGQRETPPGVFAGADWHGLESDGQSYWRWAMIEHASIQIDDSPPGGRSISIKCLLNAVGRTNATCTWNGEVIWRGEIGLTPHPLELRQLHCQAGAGNTLVIEIDHIPDYRSTDTRRLCVCVRNLEIRYDD